MFEISFGELLVIFAVALVVLGPERLPKVARTLGAMIGRLQRYVADVKMDLAREAELSGLRQLQQEASDALHDVGEQFATPLREAEQTLRDAGQTIHHTAQDTESELNRMIGEAHDSPPAPAGDAQPPTEPTPAVEAPDADAPPTPVADPATPAVDDRQLSLFDTPTPTKTS